MTFSRDLARGLAGEVRVADYLRSKGYAVWHVSHIGVQLGGVDIIYEDRWGDQKTVQVKTDYKAQETGNIYLELSAWGKPGWGTRENIRASYTDWYAWVIGTDILWLSRRKMLELAREAEKYPLKEIKNGSGYLIPIKDAFMR